MASFRSCASASGSSIRTPAWRSEGPKGFGSFYALAQILTVQPVTLTLISMNSQRIEHEHAESEHLRESEARCAPSATTCRMASSISFRAGGEAGGLLHISAGIERCSGLHAADLMEDAEPLFAPMARIPVRPPLERRGVAACASGTQYSGALLFNAADGRQVWLHVRSAPIPGPQGDLWVGGGGGCDEAEGWRRRS